MKTFFSDPQFIELLNSQLRKKEFSLNFEMEIIKRFDQNLGIVFEDIRKPKLNIRYHMAYSQLASTIFKKIVDKFPKDLFYISEKPIQAKEKTNFGLSFMRNQTKQLQLSMPETNFSFALSQEFSANAQNKLFKNKKYLFFLGEWPKTDEFKIFKANFTNFKYFFDRAKTALARMSLLPGMNNSDVKPIKSVLSEQKFISQSHFKNLCEFLSSEKWVEECGKLLKELNYDFNVVISFSKIILLNSNLDKKDLVFTKPKLELIGDEGELNNLEDLMQKTLYSIIDPKDFKEIIRTVERKVTNLVFILCLFHFTF